MAHRLPSARRDTNQVALRVAGRSQGGGAKGDRSRLVPVSPVLARRLRRYADRQRPAEAKVEEVEVEHEPVGKVVSERVEPYQDGDTLVVPIYEEQLVVTRRLVLREQLRIRRITTTQRQLFEDTLKRERFEVEDPDRTDMVHERFPTSEPETRPPEGSLVDRVRRALH